MPSERPDRRFTDIIDNLERVEQFTAGIISEAARKLGANAERLAPDQPRATVRCIGNVLRHQYDDVDPNVIWQIVQRDVATVKTASQRALTTLATGRLEVPPKR